MQSESQTSGVSGIEYTSSVRKPVREQAFGAGASTGSKVQGAAFGLMLSGGDDDETEVEVVNTQNKAGKQNAGKDDHTIIKYGLYDDFMTSLIYHQPVACRTFEDLHFRRRRCQPMGRR